MSNAFAARERTKIICVPSCARTFFILPSTRVREKNCVRKKNADARARVRAQKNRPPMLSAHLGRFECLGSITVHCGAVLVEAAAGHHVLDRLEKHTAVRRDVDAVCAPAIEVLSNSNEGVLAQGLVYSVWCVANARCRKG